MDAASVLALAVFAAASWARVAYLAADPPLDLSWSAGPYGDEGQYVHNARNMALFGVWETDGYNNMYISPVLNLLTFAAFRVLGVGHVQARIVAVWFSLAALLFLYLGLKRDSGRWVAVLAAGFLGLDYFWLQYSRLALMDIPTAFWMALAFYLWQCSLDGHWGWSIALGAAGAMAVVFKLIALPFLATPFLALAIWSGLRRGTSAQAVRIACGTAAGIAAVALVWHITFFSPNREQVLFYADVFGRERQLHGLADLLESLHRNFVSLEPAGMAPCLFLLGAAGVLIVLAQDLRRALSPGQVFLGVWLAIYAAMLYASPYSPGRYWTLLFPPLAAFAAYGLSEVAGRRDHPIFAAQGWRARIAFWLLCLLPLVALFVISRNLETLAPPLNRRAVRYPLYAALLAGALLSLPISPLYASLRQRVGELCRRWAALIVAICFGVTLAWNGLHYVRWVAHRQYSVVTVAGWLDDLLPKGAIVYGADATTYTLETDRVTIPIWVNNDWVNWDRRWPDGYWIGGRYPAESIPAGFPLARQELIARFVAQGRLYEVWTVTANLADRQ